MGTDARDPERHVRVLRGGITWRLLTKDFPPWPTVYRWFAGLHDETVFERMNHALVTADREWMGRKASPSQRQDYGKWCPEAMALLAVAPR